MILTFSGLRRGGRHRDCQRLNLKLKHWCAFQAINAMKPAPVLEFDLFPYDACLLSGVSINAISVRERNSR